MCPASVLGKVDRHTITWYCVIPRRETLPRALGEASKNKNSDSKAVKSALWACFVGVEGGGGGATAILARFVQLSSGCVQCVCVCVRYC